MYVFSTWYLVLDTCSWCFVFGTLYFLYLRIFYLRIWCRYLVPRIDVRRVCKIWAFGIWRIEHISDTLIDDQNSNTWLSMKIILLTSDKLCWKWWCILILITVVIIMRKMLIFFKNYCVELVFWNRNLWQKHCGMVSIFNAGLAQGGVGHSVVNHRVYRDCHRVACQNLK